MFRNHFKLAWRNLAREKMYAALNILGLAAGIAGGLIILLYIGKELSYDTFHTKADRIYRVSMTHRNGDAWSTIAWAPVPVGSAVKATIPEAEDVAQLTTTGAEAIVEGRGVKVYERAFVYATPSFFKLFDFPLVSGDAVRSLNEPYTLLLSETMAAKYFPDEDPLGAMLNIDNKQLYKITGVFRDIPDNSHVRFDFVASMESLYASGLDRETWYRGLHTYVLLQEHADPEAFRRKLDVIRDEKMAGPFQLEKGKEPTLALIATPLKDIHLYTSFSSEIIPQGDITYIYIFSAIVLLILVIACINYTNLATALAITRAREVGVRKLHGARKFELVRQYLSESFLFVGISLIVALMLAAFFLPEVNEITDRALKIDWTDPVMLLAFGGLWLVVGVGAGMYPAFYLSGLKAWRALRGKSYLQSRGTLRKVLITFQMTVSIALIACMLIIQSQMELVRDSRPGFGEAQVMMIPTRNEIGDVYNRLRERLRAHNSIASVSTSSFEPGEPGMIQFYKGSDIEGLATDDNLVTDGIDAGFDFEKTFSLRVVQGRSFSETYNTDLDEAVIVNEAAVRRFGWTDPLGKTISMGATPRRVVGVMEDFHYKSLRDEMVPLVIKPTDKASRFIAVRLNAGDIPSAVKQVEAAWNESIPHLPFTYSFLDESFDALYKTELRFSILVTVFSLLAVVIACLGLLGLSAFMAEQRAKEIGIRKTLGATVGNIVSLLTMDFMKWIALGLVISIPFAHYAMSRWLGTFAYKIEPRPIIYLGAGAIVLVLVLMTTGWKSIQSALRNPVDVLKSE